jgi:hypothetical protein
MTRRLNDGHNTRPADCGMCEFLGIDCSPDKEDYHLPCDYYEPMEQPSDLELDEALDFLRTLMPVVVFTDEPEEECTPTK